MKKRKKLLFPILAAAIIFLVLGQANFGLEVIDNRDGTPAVISTAIENEAPEEQENISSGHMLSVHYIDVGQGDATLITCGGEAMLIDAGDNSAGTALQMYLQKEGISNLKYVIGTHPDADHIGGMDVILYKFDCDTIIMPDIKKDTATYRDVEDVIEEKGYSVTFPVPGNVYELGDAEIEIIGPLQTYEEDNDNSIVLLLRHGSNTFLFTGDASENAENDILAQGYDVTADVYKVGHHGSYTSTSQQFLVAICPAYAVISCGADNDYGHPHMSVLKRLRDAGVKVFRTDEQGTIIATSDGSNITWNVQPSQTWAAGEKKETEETPSEQQMVIPQTPQEYRYVCNTNSMKFHLPECDAVVDMSDKNKLWSNEDREAIIKEGYSPCGVCHP